MVQDDKKPLGKPRAGHVLCGEFDRIYEGVFARHLSIALIDWLAAGKPRKR